MTAEITIFVKGDRPPTDVAARNAQKIAVANTPFGDAVIIDLTVHTESASPQMEVGGVTYLRLLDRFYLPANHDAATTDALFTRIADDYEGLVDTARNVQNLTNLIQWAARDSPAAVHALPILDFGCGTGLSVLALARLGPVWASQVRLVAFDRCAKMREIARQRGLDVLSLSGCADLAAAGPFRSAVASYVFHFGVDDHCFRALHDSLSIDGILALNFHKATVDDLHELDGRAEAAAFRLVTRYDDPDHGSISIYRA